MKKEKICISKSVGIIVVVSVVLTSLVLIISGLSQRSTSTNTRASEAKNESGLQNLDNQTMCGGSEQPPCLTTADNSSTLAGFYCDDFKLGVYTLPTKKIKNPSCLINIGLGGDYWDAVYNIFIDNKYPHKQQYEKPFSKTIQQSDGRMKTIIVMGFDLGQRCRYEPYVLADLKDTCPESYNLKCGGDQERVCIVKKNSIETNKETITYECDQSQGYTQGFLNSQLAVKGNIEEEKEVFYQPWVRKINGLYASGILYGSRCILVEPKK